ncbi:MAG: MBOAT family protein [Oscillospiraceae bacterium]|jgi:D-alanyl-lipoteichoic acid acyltransferase DltB (MBOAT superfamily)|nr:MBOAT family protein [Oscillospiraceae bacterium]
MLFTSYGFLLFIAVLLGACIICPGKHRWKILLIASLIFYGMSGLRYLAYIAVTILSAYGISLLLGKLHTKQELYLSVNGDTMSRDEKKHYKSTNKSARTRWLVICLFFNLGILATLKYADFAILNINIFIDMFGGEDISFFRFALPMGISFYTFQTVSYVVDVYRGAVFAEKNPFKLALFTSFFPQVIQGPISRFGDLSKTLFSHHRITANEITLGLQRVVLGFFKKLIIADRLAIALGTISSNPTEYNGAFVLFEVLLFAVVLYADFTGGIDITIGIAEALGVKIKENFNRPFYVASTADYWRRWHITMGTWFRDYLYYPLLTSRPMMKLSKFSRAALGDGFGKRLPIYLTTIVVWFTTGLWHGATWNFVVWGLLNGLIIIISEECSPLYTWFHDNVKIGHTTAYRAFQIARTFCLLGLVRTIYIYESVGTYFKALGTVFTDFGAGRLMSGGLLQLGLGLADYIVALIGVAFLIVIGQLGKGTDIRDFLSKRPRVLRYLIVLLVVFSIIVFGAYGIGYDAAQFIYNQF